MLNVLQSILAFVLTMLGVATLVTVVLEMIVRFTRRRARVMKHILQLVFEKEIEPLLGRTIGAHSISNVVDLIVASPFKPSKNDGGVYQFTARIMEWAFGAHESSDITAREFLVRLSRTSIGTELYDSFENKWDETIKRIETRYNELCAAASEWFKNSSAVGSLIIGVVIAFTLNFDAVKVLQYYMRNPDRSAAVSEQAQGYLDAYSEAKQRLDGTISSLREVTQSEQPTGAAAEASLKELSAAYRSIEDRQKELIAAGLPVGPRYFPYCMADSSKPDPKVRDERCGTSAWATWTAEPLQTLEWIAVVFLSGVLIGLGGPFWYEAATGLLRVVQLLRGKAPAAQDAAAAAPIGVPASLTNGDLKLLYERRRLEKEDKEDTPAAGAAGHNPQPPRQ